MACYPESREVCAGAMAEFMGIAMYLLVSGATSVVFLALFWAADRYEREPFWLVVFAAAWGALPAVLLSCIAEVAVGGPLVMALGKNGAEIVGAVLVAPPVEESAKALAILLLIVLYRHEFDDVLDGMVYGAAVGVGFSFVEDAVYFIGAISHSGIAGGGITFALRNGAFVLNHSLFGAVTGIGFGVARVAARGTLAKIAWPALGLATATALHATHNALSHLDLPGLVAAVVLHWAGGLVLVVLIPFLWGVERAWIVVRLRSEVSEGRIPQDALAALPFARGSSPPSLQRADRAAMRRDLVELAFHRKSAEDGWAAPPAGELEALRARINGRLRPPGSGSSAQE